MALKSSNPTDGPGHEGGTASRRLYLARGFLGAIEATWLHFGSVYHQITALQKAARELGICGVWETGPGTIRLVTSQAFIEGTPATGEEIATFFQAAEGRRKCHPDGGFAT